MTRRSAFGASLNTHIAKLENQLMREDATIEAALEPSIIDGKAVYYSPADGYWKKRWELQNKLRAALILREELG